MKKWTTIAALAAMTGLGGLLLQMPEAFMRELAREAFGFEGGRLAVGQVFLSQDEGRAQVGREV